MTNTLSYSFFETAIGACAIAWGPHGITAVSLPEAHVKELRSRFARRFPEAKEAAPPADISQAIVRIQALLKGEADDLADIALDDADLPAFNKRVYDALKPGGIYFVLDHQANPGTDEAGIAKLHRIEKAQVIKEVTAAGFKLVGDGKALNRATDDHTKMSSDPAIKSHTDQYMLKFQKV